MNTPVLRIMFCPQCKEALGRRFIDGIERVACPSDVGNYVHWENPTPVVAALVQHGEHFILARNSLWPPGMFSMITGFLEKGETPEQSVLRETREELGLATDEVHFIGHYSLPAQNQLIIAFAVRTRGEIHANEEIAEVLRLSRSELERFDFGRLELTARIVADGLKANPAIK
jgi:NAD+ diphosphatase